MWVRIQPPTHIFILMEKKGCKELEKFLLAECKAMKKEVRDYFTRINAVGDRTINMAMAEREYDGLYLDRFAETFRIKYCTSQCSNRCDTYLDEVVVRLLDMEKTETKHITSKEDENGI